MSACAPSSGTQIVEISTPTATFDSKAADKRYRRHHQCQYSLPVNTFWRHGVLAVSVVRRMNEVAPRRARLILGRVTVCEQVYHLGM